MKSLKKNNIALDIVHFTHLASSPTHIFLDELVAAANNSENCHIIHLLPSDGNLSDKLLQSNILSGSDSQSNGTSSFDIGGVDPELDPELALALKMSLEEEQARLESVQSNTTSIKQVPDISMELGGEDLDPELAAAIAMSLQHNDMTPDDDETDKRCDTPKRKFQE